MIVVGGCLVLLLVNECRHPAFVAGELRSPAARARSLWYVLSGIAAFVITRRILSVEATDSHFDSALPFPLVVIAAILVGELFNYAYHRTKHRIGLLWRWHFTHHIAATYSIALTVHAHFLEIVVGAIASTLLLSWLGFSQAAIDAYFAFFVLGAAYQHSAHDYSLGPLDAVIVGPAYHRLHHAANASAVNFGSTITVWDIVFRTVVWPTRGAPRPRTGIESNALPLGFFRELVYFVRLASKSRTRSASIRT